MGLSKNLIFWDTLSSAVFCESTPEPNIHLDDRLPGTLPVSALLAESVGLVGIALARLCGLPLGQVDVIGRLCAHWCLTSCKPIGWTPAEPWDPLSAVFRGGDGWIRLHTNAQHHKTAALWALGCDATKESVAEAISKKSVGELEDKIISEGGAAAMMIPLKDWQEHPQGRAVAQSPLVEWHEKPTGVPERLQRIDFGTDRPLKGLRVLDLTRVLAGPVATRTLAGYGAEVLRIDPAGWDEAGILQDTTIGKHCAGLDLRNPDDRVQFEQLLAHADVLVHGYRPGAMEGLGYGPDEMDLINPARIDVSISAYGWQGPWGGRRGFDSLVQFSTGIADICSNSEGEPGKLPVQALDHAAGYIMAASILEALRLAREGRIVSARTSLARVAWMLCEAKDAPQPSASIQPPEEVDYLESVESSDWGDLMRLRPPLSVADAPMRWDIPSGNLRRHPAEWRHA